MYGQMEQSSFLGKMRLSASAAYLRVRNIATDVVQDTAFALKTGRQLLNEGARAKDLVFLLPGGQIEYANEYMQKLYWKGMLPEKIGIAEISQDEHADISEWLSGPAVRSYV